MVERLGLIGYVMGNHIQKANGLSRGEMGLKELESSPHHKMDVVQ